MNNSTASIGILPNGIIGNIPNRVTDADGFYVSYNNVDSGLYGCDTTAVVVGQMQRFYILKGNHEKQLIGKTFEECLNYIHDYINLFHESSDPLPIRGTTIEQIMSEPSNIKLG